MRMRKGKQNGLRVSNFAFSLAIFKRHAGSEGVKFDSCGLVGGCLHLMYLRYYNMATRTHHNKSALEAGGVSWS